MAQINTMENEYTNVASIRLTNGMVLGVGQLAASGTINGISPGSTSLTLVQTGVKYIVQTAVIILTNAFGLTGTLTGSIGTNGPSYNNIVPSTTFTGLNAVGLDWLIPVSGLSVLANGGDTIYFNVVTPNGGVTADYNVYLYGVITQ